MLSNKRKAQLIQILPFGIIPAIFSLVQVLLEKGVLGNHPVYPSTGNPYDSNLLVPFVTSFITGLTIGSFETFYVNKWFQKRRFYQKLLFKSLMYTLSIVAATVVIIVLGHSIPMGLSPFDARSWDYLNSFFTDFAFWSIICYYSLAITVSVFYKEVTDNLGLKVALNFFTGKYHRPISEYRIFMFLDMKSSTSHAEKLGEIKYFSMLKDYFQDLSDPILNYNGEIYQYVGDEIVVTWKNQSENALNALDCFFEMREALKDKRESYDLKYGITPTFKAGIHYGKVTTGEIGAIKKEIVFTGDTLNTTARIQGLCNEFKAELLISDVFKNRIDEPPRYLLTSVGEVALRGRQEKISLYKVDQFSK